jgi:hypothetical protein
MGLKPLKFLWKGLKALQNQVKTKKAALEAQLAKKKQLSQEDEEWLDNKTNLVDVERVVEVLESALDYDKALDHFDDVQKGLIRILWEAAGDITKVVGKKQ